MKIRTLFVLSGLTFAASAGGGAACSSGSGTETPASEAAVGTLTAAMSAVGPDGATYTLGAGINMSLFPVSDAGLGGSWLTFNNSLGTQSFQLPVGSYTAALQGPMQPGVAPWTLTRTADGGATSVQATLLDAQPYAFTVANGGTTNLAMRFSIANVGVVTFATGTLTTTLSVDSGTVAPGHVTVSGLLNLTAGSGSGIAALDTLINTSGASVPVNYTATLTLTSPFTMIVELGGLVSCANVTGTVAATGGADAGVLGSNLAAFATEASGGTGTVCFYDGNTNSSPNSVAVSFSRAGAPSTPQVQAALGADAGVTTFGFSVGGGESPIDFANGSLNFQTMNLTGATGSAMLVNAGSFHPVGASSQSTTATVQFGP